MTAEEKKHAVLLVKTVIMWFVYSTLLHMMYSHGLCTPYVIILYGVMQGLYALHYYMMWSHLLCIPYIVIWFGGMEYVDPILLCGAEVWTM